MSQTRLKKTRTRQNYELKLASQAENTRNLTRSALNNFEKFALEKYNSDDLSAELKRSRITFLFTDASRLLRPELKKFSDDQTIFTKQKDIDNAISTIEGLLHRALKKANLDQRYESNNQYLINTHSFRAFGLPKLSWHDPNLAKLLVGQKGYLLQYDRLNPEEKLEEYQKYQSDLLLDPDAIQKAEIETLAHEKIDLTKEMDKIATQDALKVMNDMKKSKN